MAIVAIVNAFSFASMGKPLLLIFALPVIILKKRPRMIAHRRSQGSHRPTR